MTRSALLLAGLALAPVPAQAHHPHPVPPSGSPVQVEVRVGGRVSRLYAAPDGSGRLYVEATKGAAYDVVLSNRSTERVGVVLVVDGLNAISGERAEASSPRNRMYILDPWGETTVRGWRTSLSEVRRFNFVDEQASYAARAGKANRKMGWIEVGVFREQGYWASRRQPISPEAWSGNEAEAPTAQMPPATAPAVPEAQAKAQKDASERLGALGDDGAARSYPGTGWGRATYDPAQLVHFDPMPTPAQLVTVRYEYAAALRALGILPPYRWTRDRLREREHAEDGFARPPAW
ncbi:MAG TPA: hypothetical protein VFM88_04855 [Vicinamibacteria bacterium]|nr:hypothetical protein [Vicinamibacteria bacterium]